METTAVYLENEWQNADELLNINAGVMCTEWVTKPVTTLGAYIWEHS
jgi:hypothetical protein